MNQPADAALDDTPAPMPTAVSGVLQSGWLLRRMPVEGDMTPEPNSVFTVEVRDTALPSASTTLK